ncbi:insulin-like growth factor-binding protein complex acid labile subunit [Biomphalaria glabrata]|uniref:Insulin-like growth factor-binding protein complex acid labile subunit n=1 Tax=Biomphalaria glabrata TaxID=6526 RepID=A0A9W2ZV42_BIOGL|nr:insulin-like growth factor-binding protein complex acid labile subunit [Biomphalaria glabrata]
MAQAYSLIVLFAQLCLSKSVERGFVYCPAYPCSCESRDGALIINCMSLYLSALPKFLSFDGRIKELSLRFNNIRTIPPNGFQGLHIERLDLLDNAVTTINDDAFMGLENSLKALSLQLYAYDGLPTKALSKLTHLKSLQVIGCKQLELDSALFKNLVNLETLHLIGCRTTAIKSGAFTSLPKLKSLVLSSNALRFEDLQELNVLHHLTELDLSNNNIQMLDNQAFSKLSKLRYLNLANNKMTQAAGGAFYNLDFTLEELNLQDNFLKEDALKSLRYMKSIRVLDLSSNNISRIQEEDFMALRYLTSLNLADNDIKFLEKRSLIGVASSLVSLDLSGNPLETIEGGVFAEFSRLESLNFNKTLVGSALRHDTFNGAKKTLKHLHASYSGVTSTQVASLSTLHHLTELDLSLNKIGRVDFQVISAWRHLKFANFSHNNISEFLTGPLSNVNSSLKALDISNNHIEVIPDCVFFLLKELTDVKLDNNPLACNCSSSWLFRWRQITQSSSRAWSSNWQCSPINSLPRRMFSDLEFSDLNCLNSSSEEARCLLEYLPWAMENATTKPIAHVSITPPYSTDKIMYFNITQPNPSSLHVKWATRVNGLIGGFKVMLTRCNDSSVVEAVTVSPDTTHYTFYPFDRNVQQELCVVLLAEDLSHLETKCEGVSSPVINIRDGKSKEQHMYTVVHNSFVPLLLIYISGSLALAFIIACLVLCVRKNLSKPEPTKDPFFSGYPAWVDQRSSTSSLPISHDPHLFLFEELGSPEHRDFHTHSTLISSRGTASGRRLPPSSMRDYSNNQLSRRNSRSLSVPSVLHLCPYECTNLNSFVSKPSSNELLAGRAEINDEFYFHF